MYDDPAMNNGGESEGILIPAVAATKPIGTPREWSSEYVAKRLVGWVSTAQTEEHK